MRIIAHRSLIGLVAVSAALTLAACGESQTSSAVTGEPAASEASSVEADSDSGRSVATGQAQISYLILTEADAGKAFEVPIYDYDIGLPDKKGSEVHLDGDDASSLRWRFGAKPDTFIMEWAKVDGKIAFETDDLIGDPTTAAKVIELRGNAAGETTVVFELVDRDPEKRGGEPAKRLEYTFTVGERTDTGKKLYVPGGDQMP